LNSPRLLLQGVDGVHGAGSLTSINLTQNSKLRE
jgi:hypothetical protein